MKIRLMNVSSKEIVGVLMKGKKSNKQRTGNEVRSKTGTFLVPRSTCGNKNEENCRNLGVLSL